MQSLVKSVSSSFSNVLSHEAKDSILKAKAKTKDFKIVLQDPRARRLVLEDSNTAQWSEHWSVAGGLSLIYT